MPLGFRVLVPPQRLWLLVLSLAKAAFPEIPAQGEQELAIASQAVPVPPGCAAVGGRGCQHVTVTFSPPRTPSGCENLAQWVLQGALDGWGPKFPPGAFPSCHTAGVLPDPNTSHRLPVPSTGCRCLTKAGQGRVTASSPETVTLRGSEQAQIHLFLPHLCLGYIHGAVPSPWHRLCFSLPSHKGSRLKVSFPWLHPVTQNWGNVL